MKSEQFLKMIQVEPSSNLKSRIWEDIKKQEYKKAKINFWASLAGFSVSLVAIFPAIVYLWQAFSQSGLSQYLTAIFSDGGVVLTYWRDYLSLIAESMPVFEVSIFFAVIFVLLLSLRIMIRNIKPTFLIA